MTPEPRQLLNRHAVLMAMFHALEDHNTEVPAFSTHQGFAQWSAWLAAIWPEFRSPPKPKRPAIAMTRRARVAVYEVRQARGESLYHPGDLWRRNLPCLALQLVEREQQKNGDRRYNGDQEAILLDTRSPCR